MTELLVDANGLYATAWYGCGEDPFETLQRTVRDAVSLVDPDSMEEEITHTMFCWDGGQKRPKERKPRPPEYESTKKPVKEALAAVLGTVNVRMDGIEADDVIATLAFKSKADHVIVVSGDKDLQQLQGGNISYYDIRSHSFMSTREILARWHVRRTSHVALALAIQGDSSDKISGIKGWGEKKVEKLFEVIKSDMPFDKVLDLIDRQIPENKKHEFYESLELTLLNTGLDVGYAPMPLKFVSPKVLIKLGLDECVSIYSRVSSKY